VDALAAVLAIFAAVSFAFAATLWQRASMASGIEAGQGKAFLRLLTNWVWLLGLVAQIAGVLLQAAALDRGRVAIIQPLLVTTIIWALPLGYFLTHQTIAKRHIVGAAIVVVGLAVFGSLGDPAGGVDDAPTSDWIAAYLVIAAVCVGILLFGRRGGISAKAAIYGTVAGILYGVSAVLMKPVVERLHADGFEQVLANWQLWVMAVTGIGGFYLQQISLSVGRLAPSVATVSVANPVVSVLLGALVLQERLDRTPPWHAVVAIGALAVALLGAVIIASAEDKASDAESTAGNAESATGQPSPA
jgi:drug/metabolite transporter (DMT)-like permease